MLRKEDWKCALIEPATPYVRGPPHRPVVFRREVRVEKAFETARRLFVAPTKRGNGHMVQLSRQSFMMAKPTISMPGCRKV
jgi:hypothetical protein